MQFHAVPMCKTQLILEQIATLWQRFSDKDIEMPQPGKLYLCPLKEWEEGKGNDAIRWTVSFPGARRGSLTYSNTMQLGQEAHHKIDECHGYRKWTWVLFTLAAQQHSPLLTGDRTKTLENLNSDCTKAWRIACYNEVQMEPNFRIYTGTQKQYRPAVSTSNSSKGKKLFAGERKESQPPLSFF